MAAEAALLVDNITKRFGGVVALEGVSLLVETASITGIVGPNGSGKTTLFNLICGIVRPDSGRIFLNGVDSTGKPPHEIARLKVGRTFQSLRVFKHLTVAQNLAVAGTGMGGDVSGKIGEVLRFVGLEEKQNDEAGSMSYGQQKLLAFGMMLVRDASLILLDEIAAGVYPDLVAKISGMIRELQSKGKTFVVIEHDIPFITNLCSKIVVLDAGKKIAEGTPAEITADQRVIQAYLGEKKRAR